MKTGRKASGDVSADVAYAEIFAEVQKLQALLNDIGLEKTEQPKQRKKRTLKPKQQEIIGSVQTPVENEASANVTMESASTVEHASKDLSQQQIQTETLFENLTEDETGKSGKDSIESEPEALQGSDAEASELTQQEIQVETLKENLDEAEDSKPKAAHKPRYVVSNLEEIRARERVQREEDDDPFAPIKDANAEAKNQDTPSAIAPQDQASAEKHKPTALELVSSEDNKDQATPGFAETVKAERMTKAGIEPNEEVITSKLDHDKSGHAWGNWAETPADEIEAPDSPD